MQINSLLAGYADATAGGRRSETAQRPSGRSADSSAARGLAGPPNEALRTIMADYDLSRITPQRFSEMLDRLRNANVLSDEEFTQLAQIRLELDRAGNDSNDSVDLVEFCVQRVQQFSKRLGDASASPSDRSILRESLSGAARQLDWVQKLSLVHNSPDSIGLDAIA